MDSRLRGLQRRWLQSGSWEDRAAYERELERAGRTDGEDGVDHAPSTARERRLEAEISVFMRQYTRKRPKGGGEPNDRKYDRRLERKIKKMDPWELDELLNGPDDW